MEGNILNEANMIVEAADIKEALRELREYYLEEIVATAKDIYDEHIYNGFTEKQALEVSKAFVLDLCRLEYVDGQ